MSPKFQIIDGQPWHCGRMARVLRCEHQAHLLALNVDIHRQLRAIFDRSYYRKAWLVDGVLAGLGGVEGSWASPSGLIWLALSEQATRYPVAVVKELKRQLEEISATKTTLETTVINGDAAAQRLAVSLGFHAMGEGPEGRVYSRAGRRNLLEYINNEPSLRVPVGAGWQIGLIWHAEGAS